MIEMLPPHLRKSGIINEIFDSEQLVIDDLRLSVQDLRDQMDFSTATWALEIYEKEYGISVDDSKPDSERRSVLISKSRGSGQVDADLLKAVADSYTNGDCDVSFTGVIEITFNSFIGRPPNMNDVEQALEDTKPAHLRMEFTFRYYTVDEIEAMTLNDLETETLSNFAPFG